MFFQHGTDPEMIDNMPYFDFLEMINVPDEDPATSASDFLKKEYQDQGTESYYDQDIWADE